MDCGLHVLAKYRPGVSFPDENTMQQREVKWDQNSIWCITQYLGLRRYDMYF